MLGEVEVVFGFWSFILLGFIAVSVGHVQAIEYLESRHFTEPLFVFVVMVVSASKPILSVINRLMTALTIQIPLNRNTVSTWLGLALLPILGSLITEPAAMTLSALSLSPLVFEKKLPEMFKYGVLGVLFVNVSIGGTLTSFAAPPVLMVANVWNWNTAFMASNFGWRAVIAVLINATVVTWVLRNHLGKDTEIELDRQDKIPVAVCLIHLLFLSGIVVFAHHIVVFFGIFMLFLGFTQAYSHFQNPLILKEGLLVGFFLAGLVVLGGLQHWWLQPILADLKPTNLFFGAAALTALTDNAALTYLGSLVTGLSDQSKYMLVAGAVSGGGLTVIANAPNPAGVSLLKDCFKDGSIGAGALFLGSLFPTLIAVLAFLI